MVESLNPKKLLDLSAKKSSDDDLLMDSEEAKVHYGPGFRGHGVQNVVMQHTEDTVLALRRERMSDPNWHRKLYRVHKIFHELFPQHFPRFRSVLQIPETVLGESESDHSLRISVRQDIGSHSPAFGHSLKEVFDFLASIGMEQKTDEDFIDSAGDNFKISSDGNEYYVDELDSEFFETFKGKRDDVVQYMQSKQYSPEAVSSVNKSFDALERMK